MSTRKARGKREQTFLESVRDVLQELKSEIHEIKSSLMSLNGGYPLFPPPVPPPCVEDPLQMEAKGRDDLLLLQAGNHNRDIETPLRDDICADRQLETAKEIILETSSASFLESYGIEEPTEDDISSFLRSQGHYDEELRDYEEHRADSANYLLVRQAQFQARERVRRERTRAYAPCFNIKAQRFPHSLKLDNLDRGSALAADKVNDSIEPSPPIEAAPEYDQKLKDISQGRASDCAGDPDLGPFSESERFTTLVEPFVKFSLEEFTRDVERTQYILRKIENLGEHQGFSKNIIDAGIDQMLEATKVTIPQLQQYLERDHHYTCSECAYRTTSLVDVCLICGGTDIFDTRDYLNAEADEEEGYVCSRCEATYERYSHTCLNCGSKDTRLALNSDGDSDESYMSSF